MNAFRRIADTFSKSNRQNAPEGRFLRFEPLEDRALLSVGASSATVRLHPLWSFRLNSWVRRRGTPTINSTIARRRRFLQIVKRGNYQANFIRGVQDMEEVVEYSTSINEP